MRGFESQHGFSGIRIQPSGLFTVKQLLIENFYIHDTINGEGQYIGSTQAPPTPKFENVIIRNGIIARTAAEAIQLQNMCDAQVHNITMFAIDSDWLHAFQNYQSTGIQFVANGGINTISNIILDGYAANGFMPFSVSPTEYKPHSINTTILKDSLIYNGGGSGSYLNKSMSNGVKWIFDNVLFGKFNNSFNERTGNRERPMISSGGGTDRLSLKITHDESKLPVIDNEANYDIVSITHDNIPKPEYVNSGFHEPASQIMQWKQHYAPYFLGPDNTPTHWIAGQIAIDILDDYRFYICIKEHDSTDLRPRYNPLHFSLLTWDKAGIRNDQLNWNKEDEQSMFPPDNLRMVKNHPLSTWGVQIPLKERIIEEYYLDGKRVTITDSNVY